MNACLYLRYSSTSQTEQSIEGQQRVCMDYCKRQGINVVATYIDRATSASKHTEKRHEFLQMIKDAEKGSFDAVVVYKLDRFARNRYDSANYKYKLKKAGVRLISATENLSDSPESIILESVLEGMAEFYSVELAQKVTRGMQESAYKCQVTGGTIPLGYKIEDKHYVINPLTAPIVQEAFQLYDEGNSLAVIVEIFNNKGYRTSRGYKFNKSSFATMLRNEKYIGIYQWKDHRVEGGVPAIIDKDLFERVQIKLKKTADAPARGKAKVDYLLSGKIFCGHCGEPMNGDTGTSVTGTIYNYYSCYGHKQHRCKKKSVRKDWIEDIVVQDALTFLTPEIIEEIADLTLEEYYKEIQIEGKLPALEAQLHEIETSLKNITAAIERGVVPDTLLNRMVELEQEKKTCRKKIDYEKEKRDALDRADIVNFLNKLAAGNLKTATAKKRIIDLFVNSVTVYDEPDGWFKITTAYNLTNIPNKTYRVSPSSDMKVCGGPKIQRFHVRNRWIFLFVVKHHLGLTTILTTMQTILEGRLQEKLYVDSLSAGSFARMICYHRTQKAPYLLVHRHGAFAFSADQAPGERRSDPKRTCRFSCADAHTR